MPNCNPVARKLPYLCLRKLKTHTICTNTNIMSIIMNIITSRRRSTAG